MISQGLRRSNVSQQPPLEIRVSFPQSSQIDIESGILRQLGRRIRIDLRAATAVLISDANVFELYGSIVGEQFRAMSGRVEAIVLPAGESTKSTDRLIELWQQFAIWQLHPDSVVVALGGGVIGDLAGLAAATYARGLRWIGLPTSLMAQVDSGMGGKVGVNLPSAKNLVGAFWNPVQVIIDPSVLGTLGERDFRSGLAEIVKYGAITGEPLFSRIESNVEQIIARDSETLSEIITACCRVKIDIVQADPWEQSGRRAALNYGHTFAHALETVVGYGRLSHGEAVAIGMSCAARLARRLGMLEGSLDIVQGKLLLRFGLPTEIPSQDCDGLIQAMMLDKKNRAGKLRLVLPKRLGQVELVENVSPEQVRSVLLETRDSH